MKHRVEGEAQESGEGRAVQGMREGAHQAALDLDDWLQGLREQVERWPPASPMHL